MLHANKNIKNIENKNYNTKKTSAASYEKALRKSQNIPPHPLVRQECPVKDTITPIKN